MVYDETGTAIGRQQRPGAADHDASGSILAVIGLVVAGSFVHWLWVRLSDVTPSANALLETWWAQMLAVIAAVILAGLLFALRFYVRKVYASVEMIVAVATAWIAVDGKTSSERGLKLTAAVYLMIRAIDNWRGKRS